MRSDINIKKVKDRKTAQEYITCQLLKQSSFFHCIAKVIQLTNDPHHVVFTYPPLPLFNIHDKYTQFTMHNSKKEYMCNLITDYLHLLKALHYLQMKRVCCISLSIKYNNINIPLLCDFDHSCSMDITNIAQKILEEKENVPLLSFPPEFVHYSRDNKDNVLQFLKECHVESRFIELYYSITEDGKKETLESWDGFNLSLILLYYFPGNERMSEIFMPFYSALLGNIHPTVSKRCIKYEELVTNLRKFY